MLKANGLWPQTSWVEGRGQTSAWQVASTLNYQMTVGSGSPTWSPRWQCRL